MVVSTLNGDCLQKHSAVNSTNMFPNIRRGFNRRAFLVLAMHWDVFTEEMRINDTVTFVGASRHILDELASRFQFTYRFIMPEDMSWGSLGENGRWNGIIGMLQRKEADLCVTPYAVNHDRQKMMSFGYFFSHTHAVVIYKRKTDYSRNWMTLISGFRPEVYLYGLLSMVLAAAMFIYMDYGNYYFFSHGDDNRERPDLTGVIVQAVSVPLRQGYLRSVSSHSSRVMLCFWWLFCIIMTSVYTGNLIASLAVTTELVPFNTLEELVANEEYDLDVVGGTTAEMVLQKSNVKIFQKMWEKIQRFRQHGFSNNSLQHLEDQRRMLFSGGYALVTTSKLGQVLVREHCGLIMMKEKIIPMYSSFVYPKGSPLPKLFAKQIQIMVDSGLVSMWEKRWLPGRKTCEKQKAIKQHSLTFSNFLAPVVACSIGIGAGALKLAAERVNKHCVLKVNLQ